MVISFGGKNPKGRVGGPTWNRGGAGGAAYLLSV